MEKTSYSKADLQLVNNQFYDEIDWFDPSNSAVQLLYRESKLKSDWVIQICREQFVAESDLGQPLRILDLGCGAGFVAQKLAAAGLGKVVGVDLSEPALTQAKDQARKHDLEIDYQLKDAYDLDFPELFDVVVCFDFLEHVSQPKKVLEQVKRCLKPGGLFFFHTFNQTLLAHLVIIKGMEWFVPGTPDRLHVIELFIKPQKLKGDLIELGFEVKDLRGIRPKLNRDFLGLLRHGKVASGFEFTWSKSLGLGYAGFARFTGPLKY